MVDTSSAAAQPPVVQPARPVTPTPGYQPSNLGSPGVPAGTYKPSYDPNIAITNAIIHHESGGKNVTSPAGAIGPGQLMPKTAAPYTRPGEDIHNPADNVAITQRIIADYMRRYNGDMQRVAVAYFSGPGNVAPPGSPTPWIRNTGDGNNTVAQYVANTAGQAGKFGGTSVVTPAATGARTPTPAIQQAQQQPFNLGAALGALNATGQGQQQNPLAGGGGEEQPSAPDSGLSSQMAIAAATGNARQAQIAQNAAQLAASWRQQGAQPLTWGSGPYGAKAGAEQQQAQRPPGLTLNSEGQFAPNLYPYLASAFGG